MKTPSTVTWTLVALPAAFFALSASAGSSGLTLRGTTFSDYKKGLVRFDLKAKQSGGRLAYRVKGQTLAETLLLQGKRRVSFDSVGVTKEFEQNGGYAVNEYANRGTLSRYPFDREIEGELNLAGVSVAGRYRRAAVDSGLEWKGLVFDGVKSTGRLDYSSMNGYYRPEGGLSIGASRMRSGAGSKFIFNLDHYFGQNVLHTDFEFGTLKVRGTVQYSDTIETHVECSTDSDGDETCTTVEDVVARTGNYDWKIESTEGRALELSSDASVDGTDDAEVRALLAWLELVAYDLR